MSERQKVSKLIIEEKMRRVSRFPAIVALHCADLSKDEFVGIAAKVAAEAFEIAKLEPPARPMLPDWLDKT